MISVTYEDTPPYASALSIYYFAMNYGQIVCLYGRQNHEKVRKIESSMTFLMIVKMVFLACFVDVDHRSWSVTGSKTVVCIINHDTG